MIYILFHKSRIIKVDQIKPANHMTQYKSIISWEVYLVTLYPELSVSLRVCLIVDSHKGVCPSVHICSKNVIFLGVECVKKQHILAPVERAAATLGAYLSVYLDSSGELRLTVLFFIFVFNTCNIALFAGPSKPQRNCTWGLVQPRFSVCLQW